MTFRPSRWAGHFFPEQSKQQGPSQHWPVREWARKASNPSAGERNVLEQTEQT